MTIVELRDRLTERIDLLFEETSAEVFALAYGGPFPYWRPSPMGMEFTLFFTRNSS
jgi:hypothetical protein